MNSATHELTEQRVSEIRNGYARGPDRYRSTWEREVISLCDAWLAALRSPPSPAGTTSTDAADARRYRYLRSRWEGPIRLETMTVDGPDADDLEWGDERIGECLDAAIDAQLALANQEKM